MLVLPFSRKKKNHWSLVQSLRSKLREATLTSDSQRTESQPQARGNGKELLKKPLQSKANILQFSSFSLPTVFLFISLPCRTPAHTYTEEPTEAGILL